MSAKTITKEEKERLTQEFMDIMGCANRDRARSVLKANKWNLQVRL